MNSEEESAEAAANRAAMPLKATTQWKVNYMMAKRIKILFPNAKATPEVFLQCPQQASPVWSESRMSPRDIIWSPLEPPEIPSFIFAETPRTAHLFGNPRCLIRNRSGLSTLAESTSDVNGTLRFSLEKLNQLELEDSSWDDIFSDTVEPKTPGRPVESMETNSLPTAVTANPESDTENSVMICDTPLEGTASTTLLFEKSSPEHSRMEYSETIGKIIARLELDP